jgi:hypothetical protein
VETPLFKPRLPVYGNKDGDLVVDQNSSQYEYNAELNEWIYKGQISDPDVVTETADGLASPDVFRKLVLIQDLMSRGVDFSRFKLDSPIKNPYYYLFHSSDDLIRFFPEKYSEPKEVKLTSLVASLDVVNETTVLGFENIESLAANIFAGLTLETRFGDFNILSNTAFAVVIAGAETNIRVSDQVKVVKPEVIKTKLRVEVDRGRLYQKLVRNCCVGPKGSKGNKGDSGIPGDAAADEVFELPLDTTGEVFSWSSVVDTPISTPISLRVFRQDEDDNPIIDIVYPIDGGPSLIVINDEDIDIEVTSSDIDYVSTSKVFSGSFVVSAGADDIDTWRYKARQRGPQGASGRDGLSFLEVATEVLDDPSLRGVEAMISLRKSSISDDIIFLNGTLFEEIPTSNLGAIGGSTIVDVEEDLFVSAEVTINEAKNVGFFNFKLPDIARPLLNLPAWTPTSDCVQSRRWGLYKFDWFNRVEPNYLFNISLAPKPDEACCQEDFFFCPNVGDGPCPVDGTVTTPIPIPTPCSCECENPISDQFGGEGFVLPPIDLTDKKNAFESPEEDIVIDVVSDSPVGPGELVPVEDDEEFGDEDAVDLVDDVVKSSAISTVDSVIDGTVNRFIQDITGTGNIQIDVELSLNSDICGGEMAERERCAFVDSDAFRSMFELESLTDDAAITSPTLAEVKTIPATVTFTVSTEKNILPDVPPLTQPGEIAVPVDENNIPVGVDDVELCTANYAVSTLRLRSTINTTEVDYCRGYRLTITTKSDRIDPIKKRTYIITQPNSTLIPVDDNGTNIAEQLPEPESEPTTPPTKSFAPDGSVISGGVKPSVIIARSDYALGFDIVKHVVSATGNPSIFYDSEDNGIGYLVNSPSEHQVPLIFDQLHNNCVVSMPRFTVNKINAAFDTGGVLGRGTYILGEDFTTAWSSRIPTTHIRTDVWTDTILFFNEPETSDGPFNVTILARLSSSILHDDASSVFANSLFGSGISDGILVIEGILHDDPMEVINDGSITHAEFGKLTITYTNDISGLYPDIVIDQLPGGTGT